MKMFNHSSDNMPYDEKVLQSIYNQHISEVDDFFRGNDNYIKVNVSSQKDFTRLMNFLGLSSEKYDRFPHLNKN